MDGLNSVPRYHVVSRKVDVGRSSVVVNWMRKLAVEDIYHRFGKQNACMTGRIAEAIVTCQNLLRAEA